MIQVPKTFTPLYSKQQTAQLIQLYQTSPQSFVGLQSERLRDHANHYQIDFVETPQHTNATVKSVMKNYWGGLISGFTTFETQKDPPTSEMDGIARSLGHLMGFAGVMPIPAIGPFTRVAHAAKILRGHSVPFLAAKAAKKLAAPVVRRTFGAAQKMRAGAMQDTVGFLQKELVGDLAEGAFNLGVASAVSSWQMGVDQMIQSGLGGAAAGAIFRGIGNAVKLKEPSTGKPVEFRTPGTPWKKLSEGQRSEMALKALSGSLLMGLPSTLRGATTAEQIYEYLLGAYFGGNELSVKNRRWLQFEHQRATSQRQGGPGMPELIKGWDELPRDTQKYIKARIREQQIGGAKIGSLSSVLMGLDLKTKQKAEELLRDEFGNPLLNQGKQPLKPEAHRVSEAEANQMEVEPEGAHKNKSIPKEDLDASDRSTEVKDYNPVRFIYNFIDRELAGVWESGRPELSRQKKLETTQELENKWWELIQKNRKTKNAPGQEMIDWVEGTYKILMSERSKSQWIQRGHQNIKEREVSLMSPEVGYDYRTGRVASFELSLVPRGGVNKAGSKRSIFEEPKILDEVWRQARISQLMDEGLTRKLAVREVMQKERGSHVIDHVVDTSNTRLVTKTLDNFKQDLWTNEYKRAIKKMGNDVDYPRAVNYADMAWKEFLGRVLKGADKQGYYYFGGRGSAPRLYMQKYYPTIPTGKKAIDGMYSKSIRAILAHYKELSPEEKLEFLPGRKNSKGKIVPHNNTQLGELLRRQAAPQKSAAEEMQNFNHLDYWIGPEASKMHKKAWLSNIMYEMKMNGFETSDIMEGMTRLLHKGYIKNAKDLNKRLQIWFTSGIGANTKDMVRLINNRKKGGIGEDGALRVMFAREADEKFNQRELHEFSKATEYKESTDGSILVRDDVIDSFDEHWGMFGTKRDGSREYTGINKSFIVSPSNDYGAILGKYQLRGAGKEMSKIMQDKGLHMIVNNSSIKQLGQRNSYFYDINKDLTDINIFDTNIHKIKNPDIYDIPVKDVKGVFSEKQDVHFLDSQRFPKQMQSTMSRDSFSPIKGEVIRDMFDTLSGRSFDGDPLMNEFVHILKKNPGDKEAAANVLKNFEDIGVKEVFSILQSNKYPELRNELLRKMMRYNEENKALLDGSAEKIGMEYANEIVEDAEWGTIVERLIPLMKDSKTVFDHKAFRDYKGVTLKNYVVHKLTQPKIRNSAVARMIEYDPVLRRKFPQLNRKKGDEWFFLDDSYKDLRIYAPQVAGKNRAGYITLNELVKVIESKKSRKENVKDLTKILEATVMRVPMDSISGAHVLKFGGFTGRRGYGILLHPRSMKAMGGADLDGDKAWIFFGGRAEDGTGSGMKESWKDAYRSNKEEHYAGSSKVDKIISGGQIGIDQAGLVLGKKMGIETGGKMPLGYRTRAHDKKYKTGKEQVIAINKGAWDKEGRDLAELYGLEEYTGRNPARYNGRTEANVKESDGTLIFAPMEGKGASTGSKLTQRYTRQHRKHVLVNPRNPDEIFQWIRDNQIKVLNIAGSSRYTESQSKKLMSMVEKALNKKQTDNRVVIDSKSKADIFRERNSIVDAMSSTPMMKWNPYWRYRMSEAAWEGQGKLGFAVSNRNTLSAAHGAMVDKPFGRIFEYKWKDADDKWRKVSVEQGKGEEIIPHIDQEGNFTGDFISIRATNDVGRLREFNLRSRSAISIMADAMDESGIRSNKDVWAGLAEPLFDFTALEVIKGGKLKASRYGSGEKVQASLQAVKYNPDSTIGLMAGINSAAYGKNASMGRRWRSYDLRDRFDRAVDLETPNNLLAMVGKKMAGLDLSDGPLRRQSEAEIRDTYRKHQEYLYSIGEDQFRREFQEALGRSTLGVTLTEKGMLDEVLKRKLWMYENRSELAANKKEFNRFMENIRDDTELRDIALPPSGKELDLKARRSVVDEIIRHTEDFYVNDLVDMASIKHINEAYKRYLNATGKEKDLEVLAQLSELSSNMKRESAMQARDRAQQKLTGITEGSELWNKERFNQAVERGEITLEPTQSAALDNDKISNQLSSVKKQMAADEGGIEKGDLLDALLLSSLRRKHPEMIEKVKAQDWKNKKQQEDALLHLTKEGENTSVAKLGFGLRAVNARSIREHMSYFEEGYLSGQKDLTPKEVKRAVKKMQTQELEYKDGSTTQADINEHHRFTKMEQEYLDELLPFKGLDPNVDVAKLTGEEAKVWTELDGWLDKYHNSLFLSSRETKKSALHGGPKTGGRFNMFLRGIVHKDIKDMDLNDWKTINRWFNIHSKASWITQMKKDYKGRGVPEYASLMFPEAIARDQMKYEFKLAEDYGHIHDQAGTARIASILRPTHTVMEIASTIQQSAEMATMQHQKMMSEFQEEILPYVHTLPEGQALWRMSVRNRERNEKFSPELQQLENEFVSNIYETEWRATAKELDWNTLKNREFRVTLPTGKTEVLTGQQIAGQGGAINKIINRWVKTGYQHIKGDWEWVRTEFGVRDRHGKYKDINKKDKTVQIDMDKFIRFVNEAYRNNDHLPIEKIGIDGLRRIIKAHEFQDAVRRSNFYRKGKLRKHYADEARRIKSAENALVLETGKRNFDSYYPHVHELMSRKQATNYLNETLDKIVHSNLPRDEKIIKIARVKNSFFGKMGDWSAIEDPWAEVNDVIWEGAKAAEAGTKPTRSSLQVLKRNPRTGSMFSREWHMPGWSVEPEAMEIYFNNIFNKFHQSVGQLQANQMITDFRINHYNKLGPKLTNEWENFFRISASTAQGQVTIIPEHMQNDPWVKAKPYSWFTDDVVAERITKIAAKMGLKGKELPLELDQIKRGTIDPWRLAHWAKLEARFSLASLLAHPKSSVGNLYGGTVLTVINTGFNNWKNARSIQYIRANIDPNFKTREDINKWVRELGVIPEFMIHEIGINPKFKSKKYQMFGQDVIKAIGKDPEMSDRNLISLAGKHGITQTMLEKAGWFMQYPERALRRDAFVAHYIQIKNKLGGAVTERDHPLLIQMAKQGVKRTQFLYSAPNRPLFARTSLGKVWTRFQLWAWNAVRMQNDIMREADVHGFKSGTESFERAKRFLIADAMMMGLANVFAYSIFDAALPAPLSWIQDLADLTFGDDAERERAFFGAYPSPLQPLQLITPPSARLMPAAFKAMVEDDWSRMANYHVWTMLPFGRIARDIVGKGNVVKNPMMAVDKFTGIPLVGLMKYTKQEKPKRSPFFGWVWDDDEKDVVEAEEMD